MSRGVEEMRTRLHVQNQVVGCALSRFVGVVEAPHGSGDPNERSITIMQNEDVYILSAARTPVGSFQGVLKSQTAVDLGVVAAKAAMERAQVAPSDIEEAYIGCVLQAGVGQAPARQVVLRAGCAESTEATTVNKVCASGLKSVALGQQSIRLGERQLVLVGGMESMSNAPYYMKRNSLVYGDVKALDAVLNDGLTDALEHHHMGICAEATAKKHGFSREDQDNYAISSYERSTAAWDRKAFEAEMAPVTITDKRGSTVVSEDEEFRKFNKEKMVKLRPVFDAQGTVTAANASSLNDGASALVLASGSTVQSRSLKPLAKILGTHRRMTDHSYGGCGLCAD